VCQGGLILSWHLNLPSCLVSRCRPSRKGNFPFEQAIIPPGVGIWGCVGFLSGTISVLGTEEPAADWLSAVAPPVCVCAMARPSGNEEYSIFIAVAGWMAADHPIGWQIQPLIRKCFEKLPFEPRSLKPLHLVDLIKTAGLPGSFFGGASSGTSVQYGWVSVLVFQGHPSSYVQSPWLGASTFLGEQKYAKEQPQRPYPPHQRDRGTVAEARHSLQCSEGLRHGGGMEVVCLALIKEPGLVDLS